MKTIELLKYQQVDLSKDESECKIELHIGCKGEFINYIDNENKFALIEFKLAEYIVLQLIIENKDFVYVQ